MNSALLIDASYFIAAFLFIYGLKRTILCRQYPDGVWRCAKSDGGDDPSY